MLIAIVIVALLAVGVVLAMYVTANRAAARAQAGAQVRESALTTERDQLGELSTTRSRQLEAARATIIEREVTLTELEAQVTKLDAQSTQLSGVVRRLGSELDDAKVTVAEQAARIEGQSSEISALVADNNFLQARAESAEAEAAAAEARNTGIVIGDVLSADDGQPATLWSLELARSERTWRTSVAADPFAASSPFETTDDPVRLAVEVEAAALRENVGAFISIDWQAGPVADPSRAHLIVRIAQELLEAAARNPQPLRLVAKGDDDVTLRLEPVEPGGEPINLIPPSVTGDLIDVTDESGLTVTVKAN
jgi:hypothetical protein